MGAQFSKTAAKGEATADKPGEAAVASSPSKANGQENGHVKVNGDASPAAAEPAPAAKEEPQPNGSAPAADQDQPQAAEPSDPGAPDPEPAAEPADKEDKAKEAKAKEAKAKEAAPAPAAAAAAAPEAAEPEPASPAADGEASPKAEDAATPSSSGETPKKKKKRFSFKKSFKLSGFSFKKNKKEAGEGGEAEGAPADGAADKDQPAPDDAQAQAPAWFLVARRSAKFVRRKVSRATESKFRFGLSVLMCRSWILYRVKRHFLVKISCSE
ncbi:myristoylated alanine-rich C-kinase substrate [Ornithorhynchus anatinus]|uniref:myristoylated alanine-rich C-kinase substrate n=1 Tax=Ornithorhynchus anatinus TaxID=9258 RepID=UPI0019D4C8F9|nr:myristoylated alanine-rich C-kinase substrate [Ornithorhynchus anatinus]